MARKRMFGQQQQQEEEEEDEEQVEEEEEEVEQEAAASSQQVYQVQYRRVHAPPPLPLLLHSLCPLRR